jgi:Tol biopolymer transport system component
MSPEQAAGRTVDFRSDQFSFGLTLYEMATARKAFHRETTAETLTAILREEAEPLPESMPAPLRWLVERCLAKEPAQRYDSTREMAQQIHQIRDHLSELSSSPKVAALPLRRRRAPVAALVAVAALLAGWVAARLTSPEIVDQSRFRFTDITHDPGIEMMPSWSPTGDSIAYTADVDGVFQIFTRKLASSTPTQMTRMANDCILPSWSPDGTRLYYTVVDMHQASSIWTVAVAGGEPSLVLDQAYGPVLSPDGKTLAFLRRGGVWLSSPPGSVPKPYEQPPFDKLKLFTYSFALGFTPDGRTLGAFAASQGEGRFFTIPLAGGRPALRYTRSPLTSIIPGFSWLPDGQRIIIGLIDLSMVDLKSGRISPVKTGEAAVSQPAVSPDGHRIAYKLSQHFRNYDVVQVPLDGSGIRPVLDTQRDERTPSWSPAGRQFAYSSWGTATSEIVLYDFHERTHRTIVTKQDFPGVAISGFQDTAISPDGRRVAFRRMDSTGESIWITTLTGDTPVPLWTDPQHSPQRGPAWSPDGNWIAYYGLRDAKPAVLKVRVGGSAGPELVTFNTEARPLRWSPRGDWIASDLISGIMLTTPDGKQNRKISDQIWLTFGFSNDGAWIYGIRIADPRRLVVAALNVATASERLIANIGPVPSSVRAGLVRAEFPVRGFSMAPDGKSFLTSLYRESSDIWMLEGFDAGPSLWRKLLPWS